MASVDRLRSEGKKMSGEQKVGVDVHIQCLVFSAWGDEIPTIIFWINFRLLKAMFTIWKLIYV